MTGTSLSTLLHYLPRLAPEGQSEAEDDALLRRYAAQGDESAFTTLLRRHGPAVWGVCTRMLGCPQDAEDAFQATFLVLVRKARSLRRPQQLGPWLHAVAYRTALKARSARRRLAELPADLPAGPAPDAVWREVRAVLDEEVSALPEKYRVPFLLCYLGGLTNEEAARRMGCPKGTVLSRLSRARERLRRRLTRRGLAVPAGVLAAALAGHAGACAPPATLVASTARCALAHAAGAGGFPASVVALSEGVLHGMFLTKLKWAALVLLALGALGTGAGLLTRTSATPPEAPDRAAKATLKAPEKGGEPGKVAVRAPAPAKKAPEKPAEKAPPQGAELRATLDRVVNFAGIDDPKTTLGEALEQLGKVYDLNFLVNDKGFAADNMDDPLRTVIAQTPIPPMKAPLEVVLRKVLSRVPVSSDATYLLRGHSIEITTGNAVRAELGLDKDKPLPPLVWHEFDERPLGAALRELGRDPSLSVVLDVRAAKKAETAVTARLANVPLDTAVRVLADMADLDVVRLDNLLYVTTRENAARLRAEQAKGTLRKPAGKPARAAPRGGA
jgi:RNA polymerase sigma factor (sigma-70 family)